MTFHLEIITPEKVVFSDTVDQVNVPTAEGQIGILPNHAKLLSQLIHGELLVKKQQTEYVLAVEGGFIEVEPEKVTILADYAIRSEDIEVEKAQEAMKRAQKIMEDRTTVQNFAEAQSQLRRAILELKIAERRPHRTRTPLSEEGLKK